MAGIYGFLDADKISNCKQELFGNVLQHFNWLINKKIDLPYGCVGLISLESEISYPETYQTTTPYFLLILLDGFITNQRALNTNYGLANVGGAKLIADLFLQKGEKCFLDLEGSFSLLVYCGYTKRAYVVSDPYGTKPIYYFQLSGRLVFSPELKLFKEVDNFNVQLNWNALGDFFVFGNTWGTKTFIQNVKILEGGTYLMWEAGQKTVKKRYWTLSNSINCPDNIDYWIDKLDRKLIELSDSMKEIPGKKALLLSAGLDSRILACYLSRRGIQFDVLQITCDGSYNQEAIISSLIAEQLGCDVYQLDYSFSTPGKSLEQFLYLTDGQMPSTIVMHTLPLEEINKSYDVIMNGQPGNLIFGDLATSFLDKKLRILQRGINFSSWFQKGYKEFDKSVAFEWFTRNRFQNLDRVFTRQIANQLKEFAKDSFNEAYETFPELFGAEKFDRVFLENYYWRKSNLPDWAFGNYSHIVKPYLNRKNFCEFCFDAPLELKLSRNWDIATLSKYFPSLAQIPRITAWPSFFRYQGSYDYHSIYNEREIMTKYFKKPYQEIITQGIKKQPDFFNISSINTAFGNHMDNKEDNTFMLGCLVSFMSFIINYT